MIITYVSRPFQIEAVHYIDKKTIITSLYKLADSVKQVDLRNDGLYVKTKNGFVKCNLNDYIIKGDNELYPCCPKVFSKKYIERSYV